MFKIPESYGLITKPTTQTQVAPPINLGQENAQALQQLGGNLMNVAIQSEYIHSKEDEAFKASQIIDFKTELARFENEKRVALTELPATDAKAIETAKNQFLTERQKFVENYSGKFKENRQVAELIKRQANADSVDFEYDVDRVLSSKKKEYGQNVIYKSIYDINTKLSKGGNINKLKGELAQTLNTGFRAGLIDQQDIIRETEKQKAIIEDLQKQYQATKLANLVASGKLPINPNESDDKKIGELAYQNAIQNAQKQGVDPTIAAMTFVANTNYVPSEVKGIWSVQLNSGSPEQKIRTAAMMSQLINENPRLQNQFNNEDISYALEINKRSSAGIPARQVIEGADKEISKYQPLDRIAKKNIIAESKGGFKEKLKSTFKDIKSSYMNWFASDPAVDNAMETDFQITAQDYFLNNPQATPESATEYAKQKIQGEWSTTEVGQKKVMKHAPETFYSKYNGGDTSWIKKQFKNKVAEHVLLPNFDSVEKDFSLVPVPETIAAGKPSYFITKKVGDYGKMDIVLDAFNRPVVFTPNMADTEWFKEAKKEYDKSRGGINKQTIMDILSKSGKPTISSAAKEGAKMRYAMPKIGG